MIIFSRILVALLPKPTVSIAECYSLPEFLIILVLLIEFLNPWNCQLHFHYPILSIFLIISSIWITFSILPFPLLSYLTLTSLQFFTLSSLLVIPLSFINITRIKITPQSPIETYFPSLITSGYFQKNLMRIAVMTRPNHINKSSRTLSQLNFTLHTQLKWIISSSCKETWSAVYKGSKCQGSKPQLSSQTMKPDIICYAFNFSSADSFCILLLYSNINEFLH